LRAGLAPAVARGLLVPGSEEWPQLVFTPTRAPLDELAANLAACAGIDPAATRHALGAEPDRSHLLARQVVLDATSRMSTTAATGLPPRLLLVVDQFEEI